jgi:hypothetical protein
MISIDCFETFSLRQSRCLESWQITGERRLPGRNKLTLIADNHVPDDLYELTCRPFSEQELFDLTLAVVTINA